MGDFRMVIEATGGHGCDRKAKAGGEVSGCGGETCPDCLFARFVSEVQRAGMRPDVATMHHWPADMSKHVFRADDKCTRCGITLRETQATHYCKICNAKWILHPADPQSYPEPHPFAKESWSLASVKCGKCCDNVEMGAQVVELKAGEWPRVCRTYDEAHEVIDDYSERDVKYPTGAFRRATGKRIKGSF